jgi:hypothetical protein
MQLGLRQMISLRSIQPQRVILMAKREGIWSRLFSNPGTPDLPFSRQPSAIGRVGAAKRDDTSAR